MEIKEIDYGIGYTVFDGKKPLYIELNKNLPKRLRKQVLKHELIHWNAKSWWEHFKIDFWDLVNPNKQKELNKFCRKHKRAYLCNSPFFIINGKITPNWFMVAVWSIIILGFIGIGGLIF